MVRILTSHFIMSTAEDYCTTPEEVLNIWKGSNNNYAKFYELLEEELASRSFNE